MKVLLLTTGALLIAVVSFAQTDDTKKNAHGTTVSSTAKSTTDADNKGKVVSGAASSKSQADLHRKNGLTDEQKAKREAHKAARTDDDQDKPVGEHKARKAHKADGTDDRDNHGATVSSTAKSTTDADNKGKVVSEVASSKSQAGLHRQNTPEAKAARDARKAERKAAKEKMKSDAKVSDDNDDALIDAKIKAKARKDSHAGSEKHEGHEKHVKHEKPEVKGGAKGGGLKHGH